MLAVLNELSYADTVGGDRTPGEVAPAIDQLVDTLRAVRKHRSDAALVSQERWPEVLARLAPTWQADGRNRDKIRFLKALRNRAPFTSVLTDLDPASVQYTWQGRPAAGLGAAHLVDGLAVSLGLAPDWDRSGVDLDRCRLVEGDDVAMDDDVVRVHHASRAHHVAVHSEWLSVHGLRDVHLGSVLWAERADYFPNLRFLPRVEEQFLALDAPWLHAVKGLLADFQKAVRTAQGTPTATVPVWPVKVTPEGEQRKRLCWFFDPETGGQRLFDVHARFTPGPGRLHFLWDAAPQTVVVAHVGRKLGV